jgi:hypothetical protein
MQNLISGLHCKVITTFNGRYGTIRGKDIAGNAGQLGEAVMRLFL